MEHRSQSGRSFTPPDDTERADTPAHGTAHSTPPNGNAGGESFISEIIRFSVIALIIVLPIRIFIAQPFIVSGASMETTFSSGEYLIVDQLSYRFHKPERGDVIIFRYPKDPSKFFIKRIIGVPGDTVTIDGRTVTVTNDEYPDGITLEEPYVLDMSPSATDRVVLGESEYYVMGDNRDASSDSRMWGILREDKIVGQAFMRLFPLTELEYLPGEYSISDELTTSN